MLHILILTLGFIVIFSHNALALSCGEHKIKGRVSVRLDKKLILVINEHSKSEVNLFVDDKEASKLILKNGSKVELEGLIYSSDETIGKIKYIKNVKRLIDSPLILNDGIVNTMKTECEND